MNHQQHAQEHDELRARFTAWLETLVYRCRAKYLSREYSRPRTVSLEDLSESELPTQDFTENIQWESDPFSFEEDRLAAAFASLPIKRQQILTMLFVQQKKPEEISRLLNCSVQHVYDQRYQALKKLRLLLSEEDENE